MTRQVVVGILALWVLSLAACQAPPQTLLPAGTGQLLSERSQVFFQKRGQAAEEVAVNGTRAAGAGDEMWTQSRGRALLRFRDLWARLYDDTAFHATDVTPSSIKATLGSGAVLIGEPSQSPERVEIFVGAPPRVRVVLAGTLVMVAYIPAQQVVLVRTFDGKVDVSVLASGQSIQSGGDGAEWVLVGPDGRIATPSQDDVRALARRAGIWDQYHEIEVDAAGFGPPASRIPAERVTMTFIEKTAVPPTRVAPPSPKSTATPAPACRPGVLYCEDFEDGLANGWVLMDASGKPSSGWKVTREGTDYVFAGEGHQWATLENRSWGDYRVRFRLKLLRGGINLNRLSGANRYVVEFDQNGARLFKVHPNFLAASKTPHELNRWHDVEILGRAGHIQVYVDGDLEIDFVDRDPWQRGAVAFEVWEDSQVQVDDIEVLPAGPESAPAQPMAAPTRIPTRTRTPTLACRPGVLYCEDFEDGRANGWVLMDARGKPSSGWKVTREGTNYVFGGEGHQWATLENRSWGDYRVRFRLKLQRGAIHLNYRLGEVSRYFIGFHEGGLSLSRQVGNTFTDLTSVKASHAPNRWHTVEIAGWGGHLQVSVDGKVELDYTDAKPLRNGTIAFESLDDSSARVDDIEVLPAGPEPAPAAMVAPTRTPTPRRPPTRTPTPTRTRTPAPACRPGVLYCEDFEDGRADGWVLMAGSGKPSSGWKVIREGTNTVFEGEGHQWATLENHSWGDYRVRYRLKLQRGAIHLNYRLGEVSRYFIGFHEGGLSLSRQVGNTFTDLANVEASHAPNRWHTVEIAGWGGHLQVSVDGKVELDYTDAKPLRNGTIAFESLDDSSARVDDIELLPAGPEPAVRPAQPKPQAQPQPQPQPQAKPTEVRTPSKPVITDIRTSDVVSMGGLHEPECGSSKVAVSARVTSPYRLANVQMWRSDLATWSEMVSQGDNLYVSSQNFKAGHEFRVRAEDEFGDTTETDTLPSPCMRVGLVVNRLSGKCIDVKGSPAVNNEAPLQLWDCEDGWSPTQTDQRWGMTSDGFIQNALSGKCIDAKGGPAVENGSPLQLWDCEFGSPSAQTDQKWELTADGFIRSQLSGKCIDVVNSSGPDYEAVPGVDNEAALQLWDCEFSQPSAATDQRWQWR